MQVTMEMPTAVEGKWQLQDADGKIVASQDTNPGAVMVIQPYFYSGQYSQTLTRVCVAGKRGRKTKAAFKVASTTGQVRTESMDKAPKHVEAMFDRPLAKPRVPEDEQ